VDRIGTFDVVAPLWQHEGAGGWYFMSLPADVAADIDELTTGLRHGFGSVRVAVTVGSSSWRTSVFPDAGRGTYVLPVKKAVRVAERLEAGAAVRFRLELVDL
jgi:Domain of unknown function (DUF1905)